MGKHVKTEKPGRITPAMRYEHQSLHEQMDLNARQFALELAMRYAPRDVDPSDVIKTATDFHAFLDGQPDIPAGVKRILNSIFGDQPEETQDLADAMPREGFTDDSTGFRDAPSEEAKQYPRFAELTLEEAVFQALGAASTCWEGPINGEFDGERAKQIGLDLMERIQAEKGDPRQPETIWNEALDAVIALADEAPNQDYAIEVREVVRRVEALRK